MWLCVLFLQTAWGQQPSTEPGAGPGCGRCRPQWAGAGPGALLPAAGFALPPPRALSAPSAPRPGPPAGVPPCSAPAICAGCLLGAGRTCGSGTPCVCQAGLSTEPHRLPLGPGRSTPANGGAGIWWGREGPGRTPALPPGPAAKRVLPPANSSWAESEGSRKPLLPYAELRTRGPGCFPQISEAAEGR